MRVWQVALPTLLLLAPTAVAQEVPSLFGGADDGWSDGAVVGIGVGSVGLAALAGLAYYLGVGGLRHVDKDNVLEHPMRQSLLTVVKDEPGVHLRELANRHGTAVTNTQWHLRKLELAGLVSTRKVQGRRLYYPKEGGIAMRETAIQNAAVQNENARAIVEHVVTHPGINQRMLAESLQMNPGTVRWHLRKLDSAGLVRSIQDGTQNRYFPVHAVQRPPRPGHESRLMRAEREATASQE